MATSNRSRRWVWASTELVITSAVPCIASLRQKDRMGQRASLVMWIRQRTYRSSSQGGYESWFTLRRDQLSDALIVRDVPDEPMARGWLWTHAVKANLSVMEIDTGVYWRHGRAPSAVVRGAGSITSPASW